ncbi:hypothetical protein NIA69_20835 [Gemmiger formicilis]|nr:hypothetical protein [Gemmiger formicilis]
MVPNDDTPRTYTFYDLQGNEIGHNAAPAGVDVALIMEYLLDDGRVVLTLGATPRIIMLPITPPSPPTPF